MKRRRGMTLLETVLAIVIAATIALLVYAAAGTGLQAGERVTRHRETTEAEAVLRALLLDALRHVPAGAGPGDTVFTLNDATTAAGLPADGMLFHTRGLLPPRGASALWRVTLAPTSAGLALSAVPLEGPGTALGSTLPGVRGLSVRVVAPSDSLWTEQWSSPGMMPRAVELRFLDASGVLIGTPFIARVGTEVSR